MSYSQEDLNTMSRRQLDEVAREYSVDGKGLKVNEYRTLILEAIEASTKESDEPEEVVEVTEPVEDTEVTEPEEVVEVTEPVEVVETEEVVEVTEPVEVVEAKSSEPDVESFYLQVAHQMIKSTELRSKHPGVSAIKKDPTGKDRVVVPVNKTVFDEIVKRYDDVSLDVGAIDQSFKGIDKKMMACVVYNYFKEGHIYIRSNYSSQFFYL